MTRAMIRVPGYRYSQKLLVLRTGMASPGRLLKIPGSSTESRWLNTRKPANNG
jgi:hypothetical protein